MVGFIIRVRSVQDLEAGLRNWDPCTPVIVKYVGGQTSLFDAAVLFRRSEAVEQSYPGRYYTNSDMQGLRGAAEHSEALETLEHMLDLLDVDLREGNSLREDDSKDYRFDDIRKVANEVLISAHPSQIQTTAEGITIGAQSVARVAQALGVAPDSGLPKLTDRDFEWLLKDYGGTASEIQTASGVEGAAERMDSCPRAEGHPEDGGAASVHLKREILPKEMVQLLSAKVAEIHAAISAALSGDVPW